MVLVAPVTSGHFRFVLHDFVHDNVDLIHRHDFSVKCSERASDSTTRFCGGFVGGFPCGREYAHCLGVTRLGCHLY
jgi:hypothetical protein